MLKVNVQEAKVHLSRYLDAALRGEHVVLCRRNVAVAELRPLAPPAAALGDRRIGIDRGRFSVPPSFFEPLPEGILAAFSGRA